ncbi:MAG: hypothetical protein F6K28_51870, partial [Microcoleus sp. SIO2G3]|nr:hypothetical protein [Microcoleus sp. SIO2G3]
LEAKTAISFDRATVQQQLEEQGIESLVDIKVKLASRYDYSQPKTLSVTVQNKSQNAAVYVDWDRCAFTDNRGQARRVIRITPDRRSEDLFQPQMSSTVTPGSSLSATVTAEDLLRPGLGDTLEPKGPLVDPKKAPLNFALYIAMRISNLAVESGSDRFYTIACPFRMSPVPWHDALPFNPKS